MACSVAGAERWDVGLLPDASSVTFIVVLSVKSEELNEFSSPACILVTDTGPDLEIDLSPGPSAPGVAIGPYDVVKGQVAELPAGNLGPVQCLADDRTVNDLTITDDVSPCGATFYIAHRGAGLETDYGAPSRVPRSSDCPIP